MSKQCDWCPYKKRTLGHDTCEDHVKIQGENSHLPAKEKVHKKSILVTPLSQTSSLLKL